MMMMMMMMAVIVRWCPPLSVDPCIGRHTHYKTLAQKEDDDHDCDDDCEDDVGDDDDDDDDQHYHDN